MKYFLSKRFTPAYLGLIVLLADIISKFLTQAYLPLMQGAWHWYPYGGIGIFKNFLGIEFSISHQINHGAAWGIFSNFQLPLLYLRIGLIAVLLMYAIVFNRHPSWNYPLALIIAGALGNVIDYFLYGHVVDMLHFVLWGYDFPVFNLADTSIFIGICWLLIASSLEKNAASKTNR
jgi:signal peptidase II